MSPRLTYCFLIFSFVFFSCGKEEQNDAGEITELPLIPSYFPDIIYPTDNEFTKDRWELGKKLFFDPVMSIDSTLSCGSCHDPAKAFTDNLNVSQGVYDRLGTRNSPSLSNVAFHPYFTREGGVPTLEMQVLVPIQEHNEFAFNIVEISKRLNRNSTYVEMSQKAYGRAPDHYVITRAIACFERTLISGRSEYDEYLTTKRPGVLSADELEGMNLFFSKRLNCSNCHGGFDFTDYGFKNNGLYKNYTDPGRFRFTKKESDRHLFKTPSLRNVELTSPYMHDGSLNSLEEVVEHYNKGGAGNPEMSGEIRKPDLSEMEKKQLIQFLKTLTDDQFVQNSKYYE